MIDLRTERDRRAGFIDAAKLTASRPDLFVPVKVGSERRKRCRFEKVVGVEEKEVVAVGRTGGTQVASMRDAAVGGSDQRDPSIVLCDLRHCLG